MRLQTSFFALQILHIRPSLELLRSINDLSFISKLSIAREPSTAVGAAARGTAASKTTTANATTDAPESAKIHFRIFGIGDFEFGPTTAAATAARRRTAARWGTAWMEATKTAQFHIRVIRIELIVARKPATPTTAAARTWEAPRTAAATAAAHATANTAANTTEPTEVHVRVFHIWDSAIIVDHRILEVCGNIGSVHVVVDACEVVITREVVAIGVGEVAGGERVLVLSAESGEGEGACGRNNDECRDNFGEEHIVSGVKSMSVIYLMRRSGLPETGSTSKLSHLLADGASIPTRPPNMGAGCPMHPLHKPAAIQHCLSFSMHPFCVEVVMGSIRRSM
ncbi:hypothetical protein BDN70DRAFT_899861 [Pholiota conissans]|uniref:Uncharacterized protein n=1 Tax=Pholiota conissans TaxID=109636 RepID=A0A9P5YP38_9AGAR|nr:hypothetical protein BDN70DRAFT_899861 [Pholiota conissans]